MSTTLFSLIAFYDHDYQDEDGKKVHSYRCRRCALERMAHQIVHDSENHLRNLRENVGAPVEAEKPSKPPK